MTLLRTSIVVAVLALTIPVGADVRSPADDPHPQALVGIFDGVQRLRTPPQTADGLPDYSADAVRRQIADLESLQRQLAGLDPAAWPAHLAGDYLIVRSELDLADYGLRLQRPTSRNPNFYVSAISSAGMLSGATLSRLGQLSSAPPPFDAERTRRLIDHMRAVPRILGQAQVNLTEPSPEATRWALASLDDARAGSARFAAALGPLVPSHLRGEFDDSARKMGDAFGAYEDWLRARLPSLAPAAPPGRALYDWLLRRVWLVSWNADEIRAFGQRELDRYLAATALEEARNAGLPPVAPAATTAAYIERTAADERAVRGFLASKDLLSVPSSVGAYRRAVMPAYLQAFSLLNGLSGYSGGDGSATKYAVPEQHPYSGTYWEAIMRADPSTNIFHDGIPGHHFQGIAARASACPLRRAHRDRFKSEGWCTYWEEAAITLGFYDGRPRSRELMYSYLRLRALRVLADVDLALGRIRVDEAVDRLMTTPMDHQDRPGRSR